MSNEPKFSDDADAIQQMRAMTKHASKTMWACLMNDVANYLETKAKNTESLKGLDR